MRGGPGGTVSVSVERGARLVLLGEARTGKTALLDCIAGFAAADGGDIRLDGRSILRERPERRGTALLPARGTLFPHRSLRDNLLFALRGHGLSSDAARLRADALLSAHGLASVAGSRPARLSPAQRLRGELARALAASPALLLIDSAPDAPPLALALPAQTDVTAVLATDSAEAALGIGSTIILLDARGVVQIGTPHDLYERPVSAFAARFMGPCNLLPSPGGMLAIRPHRLRLDPAGTLHGQVVSVAYRGSLTRVLAATASGEVEAHVTGAPRIAPGDSVRLGWEDADAWPLPAGG